MQASAGLLRRMACWVYEGMLLFGLVFVAGYLFSALSQTRHALAHRHALQFFVFVVMGIYFVWFWSRGQTLAMKTWRIRILDTHGQALTQSRALLRYLLCWVWFLPPLAASFWLGWHGPQTISLTLIWVVLWALSSRLHPSRQFWHDAWARTQLLNDTPP